MFPCEKSVRQMWSIHPLKNTLYLTTTTDWNSQTLTLCVGYGYGDSSREYLRLTDCSASAVDANKNRTPDYPNPIKLSFIKETALANDNKNGHYTLKDEMTGKCVTVADGVQEAGALLTLEGCQDENNINNNNEKNNYHSQQFYINDATGEITVSFRNKEQKKDELCLTAGWPFLTGVTVQLPAEEEQKNGPAVEGGSIVTVIMNEAHIATTLNVIDLEKDKMFSLEIPGRAMQTIVY
jgi:hypothetical protein